MQRSVTIYDKIGSLIPGYTGYADRNNRRKTEKILRDKICHILLSCETKVNQILKDNIKNQKFDQIQDLEDIRKKISTVHDKLQYSPYGESSFFSNEQLKEDELFLIYQKDLGILEKAEELNSDISFLKLNIIHEKIQEIEGLLADRNEYIKEYK